VYYTSAACMVWIVDDMTGIALEGGAPWPTKSSENVKYGIVCLQAGSVSEEHQILCQVNKVDEVTLRHWRSL